jgi:hypothetical protein
MTPGPLPAGRDDSVILTFCRTSGAAVSVVPQGLRPAAVTADTGPAPTDTGPASASYDVDAATMHLERHERGVGVALLE